MTPLAEALGAIMLERDWVVADLARATGIKEDTIRGFTSGRTTLPHTDQRRALDQVLAPGLRGATRQICEGKVQPPRYPTDQVVRACQAVQRLDDDAAQSLADLLDRLVS